MAEESSGFENDLGHSLQLTGKSTNNMVLLTKLKWADYYMGAVQRNENQSTLENILRNMLQAVDDKKLKKTYIEQYEGYLQGIANNTKVSEEVKVSQKNQLFAAVFGGYMRDVNEFTAKTEINCVSQLGQDLTEEDCEEFIMEADK